MLSGISLYCDGELFGYASGAPGRLSTLSSSQSGYVCGSCGRVTNVYGRGARSENVSEEPGLGYINVGYSLNASCEHCKSNNVHTLREEFERWRWWFTLPWC